MHLVIYLKAAFPSQVAGGRGAAVQQGCGVRAWKRPSGDCSSACRSQRWRLSSPAPSFPRVIPRNAYRPFRNRALCAQPPCASPVPQKTAGQMPAYLSSTSRKGQAFTPYSGEWLTPSPCNRFPQQSQHGKSSHVASH